MQVIAINAPQSEIKSRLFNYLKSRKYKIEMQIEPQCEFTASRRVTFFKRNYYYFKLIHIGNEIFHLIIKVNPQHKNPTPNDLNTELSVAESMHNYF